ncbi:hypothetical protein [Nocardioides caldifontis]|uniref:hypothetical protein n=1 Tax=Nocardioides caldifontis TaxID=2588938 RepID=UPI0011DF5F0B|nr:hypothetical protein [Nocardioides caldifontis]
MSKTRTTTAALGAAALVATTLGMTAGPAAADGKDREFRIGGAQVDFSVEKDDGRFEVDVDIDDARPGSKWRVVLWHDGKRFHKKVHRADREGDVDIDKRRSNTKGKDTFKVKVEKIGGGAKSRTIVVR